MSAAREYVYLTFYLLASSMSYQEI